MYDLANMHKYLLRTFFVIGLIFTAPAVCLAKQQSVLLGADGKPLSNEVLELLSSGASLLAPPQKAKGSIKTPLVETGISKKSSKNGKRRSNSTPELEKELLNALKEGQTIRAKKLIKAGVKVNYKNYKGETPIAVAVKKAWASMVLELLENGADIHQKGTKGVTLLHDASSRGLTDVAKVLMKHGLNPASKTDKKWTSLHVAARYGHWELVRLFVQMGVDPNVRNSDGKTALELARHLRHQGVVKILSRVTTTRPRSYSKLLSKKTKVRRARKTKK